jgi:hypothetical protein
LSSLPWGMCAVLFNYMLSSDYAASACHLWLTSQFLVHQYAVQKKCKSNYQYQAFISMLCIRCI